MSSFNRFAPRVPLDERESTEWDLRFDVDASLLTIDALKKRVQEHLPDIVYVLISGEELGNSKLDRPVAGKWMTKSITTHVHIALITKRKLTRPDVLRMFREYKVAGEYCTTRKINLPYIGWRVHHMKLDTKTGLKRVEFEYGTLPIDNIESDVIVDKIYYALRNYGTDAEKAQYKAYWNRFNLNRRASGKRALELAKAEHERCLKRLKSIELRMNQLKEEP